MGRDGKEAGRERRWSSRKEGWVSLKGGRGLGKNISREEMAKQGSRNFKEGSTTIDESGYSCVKCISKRISGLMKVLN